MVDRFQQLFDSLTEEVVVVDQASQIVYANPAWLRRVGLSPSLVLGKSCHKILLGSDIPCAVETCASQQVFKTGQPVRMICSGHKNQSPQQWDELSASPVFDASGLVSEVVLLHVARPVPPETDDAALQSQQQAFTVQDRVADALHAAVLLANSGQGLDAVLESVLEQLGRVVNYDSASITLMEEQGGRIIAARGFPEEAEIIGVILPPDDEKAAEMEETRQPIVLNDVYQDPDWLPVPGTEHIRSWIGAPLLAQGRMIGTLNLDKAEAAYYQPKDAQLVMAFASQVAVVIENARLLEAERRRTAQLSLIGDISQSVLSILEPDVLLQRAVEAIQRHFGYYYVGVLLVDEAEEHVVVTANSNPDYLLVDAERQLQFRIGEEGITGRVAATGQEYMTNDVSQDPIYIADDLLHEAQAEIVVPIQVGDRVVGVLDINSDRINAFDEDDLFVAQNLADQLAIGLENARLFAAEARRRREAETLQAATEALGSTLDLQTVFEMILSELQQVVPYDSASVQRLEEKGLRIIGGHGFPNLGELLGISFDPTATDNPNRQVLESRTPLILGDAPALYEEFRREPHAQAGIRSWLGVPLLFGNRLIGMIALDKKQPDFYAERHARLASAFATQAAIAIENAQLFHEAHQRLRELSLLFEMSAAVSISLDADEVAQTTAEQMTAALGVDACAIHSWDREQDAVVIVLDYAPDSEWWESKPPGTLYPLDDYPASRRVLNSRQTQTVDIRDPDADLAELAWMNKFDVQTMLMIPMIVRDEVVGLLELMQAGEPRDFSSTEIELCQTLTNQAAAALENARLFQETEARVREMTALAAVGQASTTLELDDLLESIAENAILAVQTEISSVYILDEEQQVLTPKSIKGLHWEEFESVVFKVGEGTIGRVVQFGQALVVEDAATDPVFAVKTEAALQIRNLLTVPLAVKTGIIGALEVCNKIGSGGFTATDERLLSAFAAQAAIVIENARLFQAEREQRGLAEALRQAASGVGSSLDLDQVLDHILEQVGRVIPGDVVNIMLIDGDYARSVRWRGYQRFSAEEFVASAAFLLAETPSLRRMQETGKALVIPDTKAHPDWAHMPEVAWLRSYAGAPIRIRDEVLGFLNADSATPNFFNRTHAERLQAFADQAGWAIANARLYQDASDHLEEALVLNNVSRAAISSLDLDNVLRRGLSALIGVRNFERVHVLLLDEASGELWLHPALQDLFLQRSDYRIPVGRGLSGMVAETGQPIRLADVRQFPDYIVGYPDTLSELCVPLQSGDRIIGVLNVQSTRLAAFSAGDERFLVTLAGQLSTVIDNAYLFGEAQQRVRELTALTQVSQALNEATDLNTILNIVLEEAFSLLKGNEASVILIDPPDSNRLRIVADQGLGRELVNKFNSRPVYTHEGTYRRALRSGQIVEVAETEVDPDFLHDVGSRARAVTNVPLNTARGAIGLIAIEGLPQNDTTRRLLMALADMAAVAISKERLRTETSDRLSEVTTLYTLATQITSSLSPDTVMESIVAILKLTLDCRACSIFLLGPSREYLQLEAGSGLAQTWKGVARLNVGEGVSGRVISERRSIYVPDTQLESDFIYFDPSIRSLLVVPLIVRNKVIGTLSIDDVKPNAFDGEDRLLTIAAAQAAVAIENAQLYNSLQQSYTDLEHTFEELRHLDQMKSEFVQNISHELRTPLTFIKGYIELLQDGDMGELQESQKKAMNIVAAKSDVLSTLVDDIISLQQADRAQRKFEQFVLTELGHGAIQAAQASAGEIGIDLVDEVPDELPPIMGDRQRLVQVFDNLLGNALKFSNPGDSITVRIFQDGEMLRTEVEDTGIGIEVDQLDRIFDRFYQVDGTTTRRYGGTGLGLAIVKEIVETHGGRVGVESEPKVGSTFHFTIPIKQVG